MNLNRKVCCWLGFLFITSTISFYFCEKTHQAMSQVLMAIFTGSFVSIIISIINYWHEKEKFFNNLFHHSVFIYSYLENIKQLLLNSNEISNFKYISRNLINYSKLLESSIHSINFRDYSPFNKSSKEFDTIQLVEGLCTIFNQYIILPIHKIEALEFSLKELKNVPENEIKDLQQQIAEIISNLHTSTELLQAEYSKNIQYLYRTTDKWEVLTKNIKEFTSNHIKEHIRIQNSINRPK